MTGQVTAANYASGNGWKITPPTLVGTPKDVAEAGFSGVAMTQTMKIYLVSPLKGEIHEYSTDSSNALSWVWQGKVVV